MSSSYYRTGTCKIRKGFIRSTVTAFLVFGLSLLVSNPVEFITPAYAATNPQTGSITNDVSSNPITINGILSDWGNATYFADDPDDVSGTNNPIDFLRAAIAHDSTNFYVAYENRENIHPTQTSDSSYLEWGYQTYMDTDKDSSTGYQMGGIGADYILEGNKVKRYTGTGQGWVWETQTGGTPPSAMTYQNKVVEMRFARSLIGNPSSMHVIFSGDSSAFDGGDATDLYPDTGFFTYDFTETGTGGGGNNTVISNEVTSGLLTINGLLSDWSTLTPFEDDPNDITGVGNVIDWQQVTLAHDNDSMYLAYRNFGNIDPNNVIGDSYISWGYQAYLDTDNDASTGYSIQGIGADFIIEGGSVQQYTGTGSDWSLQGAGSATDLQYDNETAEMKIARSLFGNPENMRVVFSGNSGEFGGTATDFYPDLGHFEYSFSGGNTPTVPGAPILISPRGDTNDTTPAYTWYAVPNATQYIIKIDDSSSNGRWNEQVSADRAGCGSGSGICSLVPAFVHAEGAGGWYLKAVNNAGSGGTAYTTFNITTGNTGGGNTGITTSNTVTSNQLTINGILNDWGNATFFENDPDDVSGANNQIDFLQAAIAHDSTNFYVAYESRNNIHPTQTSDNSHLEWGYQTYMDTDKDSSTGYQMGDIGADYILEGNSVSRYAGTGQDWSWSVISDGSPPFLMTYQNKVVEMRIERSSIGNPSSMHVIFSGDSSAFDGGDASDLYPDTGHFTYNFSGGGGSGNVPAIPLPKSPINVTLTSTPNYT